MGGGFRLCFNPLDRVKFVQIPLNLDAFIQAKDPFQSPRSGQICSNLFNEQVPKDRYMFQSPRSGQICSNTKKVNGEEVIVAVRFQSPRSGQICSNDDEDYFEMKLITQFQSPRSGQICSNIEIISFTLKM